MGAPREALASAAALLLAAAPLAAQVGDVRQVHDPCAIFADGAYYVFSTYGTIPVRRSEDLHRWSRLASALPELPPWTREVNPDLRGLWAPDISRFGGEYRLYYAASSFGKNRSAIGLAVSKSLDPASADHRWVDRGKVIESRPGADDWNAIDPSAFTDAEGRPWLAFGSFWSGIKLRRLDPATGLLSPADDRLYSLASRGGGAIEAPCLVRHGGSYYLFVSFDRCCRGVESDYKVMVGRSPDVAGPYADRSGRPMLEGGGTLVLAGSGDARGPGGQSVLPGPDGRLWLVHHMYDAAARGAATLQVRPLTFDEDGWPLVGQALSPPSGPEDAGTSARRGHARSL